MLKLPDGLLKQENNSQEFFGCDSGAERKNPGAFMCRMTPAYILVLIQKWRWRGAAENAGVTDDT
jgi:hypothetical protein